MRTATIQEIQDNFDEILDIAQTEPIGILDEHGVVTTVLIGYDLYKGMGGKDSDGREENDS